MDNEGYIKAFGSIVYESQFNHVESKCTIDLEQKKSRAFNCIFLEISEKDSIDKNKLKVTQRSLTLYSRTCQYLCTPAFAIQNNLTDVK